MFSQPPLVWKVAGAELSVRALRKNQRPSADTSVDDRAVLEYRRGLRRRLPGEYARAGSRRSCFARRLGTGVLSERVHAPNRGKETPGRKTGLLPNTGSPQRGTPPFPDRMAPAGGETLAEFIQRNR